MTIEFWKFKLEISELLICIAAGMVLLYWCGTGLAYLTEQSLKCIEDHTVLECEAYGF